MKKRLLSILLAMVMVIGICPVQASAEEFIEVNETNFPDKKFREYVAENIDTDKDGTLSWLERACTLNIQISNKGVTTMKGLEYFTDLRTLDCSGGNLEMLDVRQNTDLIELTCGNNILKTLDLSNNVNLEHLVVNKNELTELDLSKNINLEYVYCSNNPLEVLDFSANEWLQIIYCGDCRLTSLDISQNVDVTLLYADDNQYPITIGEDRTFDMTTLPGNFDVSKVGYVFDGTLSGNILTVDEGATTVRYDYDCGLNETRTFTLVPEVVIPVDPKITTVEITGVTEPTIADNATFESKISADANYKRVEMEGELPDGTPITAIGGWMETDHKVSFTNEMLYIDAAAAGQIYYPGGETLTFQKGKYYTFVMEVEANEGCYFTTDTVVTVNGKPAKWFPTGSERFTSGQIFCSFYCWDETPFVYENKITVTDVKKPVAGEKAEHSYTLPDDAKYSIFSLQSQVPGEMYEAEMALWLETDTKPMTKEEIFAAKSWDYPFTTEDDITFETGKYYTRLMWFVGDDIIFTEDMTATINGRQAEIVFLEEQCPLIWYTFYLDPNGAIPGDVNDDGIVNAQDALAVLEHAANIRPITEERAKTAADITEDGVINAADALYILEIAAGIRK